MRKGMVLILALALVLGFGASAMATNGYQLIGIGQLQKSMGGAVTAAPRDSMTAITNPAGMSRVGKRTDFSMEAFMPVRSVDFTGTLGGKTEGGTDMYGIPAIGWTAPTNKEGLWFGGGMYGTSGLGVDYGDVAMNPGATFNGYSSIMFWKMAPTLAWDINDKATVGFALNLDYQSVAMSVMVNGPAIGGLPLPAGGDTINFDLGRPTSQFGLGFTIGGLYDINDMVTVGAMYSTKQNFSEAEFRLGANDVLNYNGAMGYSGTYKMDLDYPPQLALGVAIKPMDKLLVAVDFKQIYWSETHDKVKFSGPAGAFMTMSGPVSSTELNFGWEDQTVYALGVMYSATEDLDISVGFNQADAPIDSADVFNNLILPAVVETHYTLGADYKLGTNWGLGLTYMKAKSEELTGTGDLDPNMGMGTDSNAKIALEEDSYGMQLSYRF